MSKFFEKDFCVIERSQIEQALYTAHPDDKVAIYEIVPCSIEEAVLSGRVSSFGIVGYPYEGWILQAWRCEYALLAPFSSKTALEDLVVTGGVRRKEIRRTCYVVLPVQKLIVLR